MPASVADSARSRSATSLAEVVARRLADARDRDRPVLPEVDLVQVRLEDLVLRVAGVEDHGHDRLDRLAPQRPLRREIEVLDELLRQRRAALRRRRPSSFETTAPRLPADRDAGVPVEVPVLGHEDRRRSACCGASERRTSGAVLELLAEDRAEPLRLEDERGQAFAVERRDRLDGAAADIRRARADRGRVGRDSGSRASRPRPRSRAPVGPRPRTARPTSPGSRSRSSFRASRSGAAAVARGARRPCRNRCARAGSSAGRRSASRRRA